MTTARRRRYAIRAIALSAVVHAAVLTVLWFQRPSLPADLEPAGPPEAIIPVLILPRAPPPAAGAAAPAPIRLHRRSQRFAAEPTPVAPLQVPEPKTPSQAQAPAAPSPVPPAPLTSEVRASLRLGRVGCANADALNLTRAEREACDEQFASGAKDAPFIAPAMSAAKRAELQAAGARKDALMRARETPLGVGNAPRTPEPQDYDGEPYITGAGASALGQVTYPPSKRAAKKLQRLPP
jgi:hypothetical protein